MPIKGAQQVLVESFYGDVIIPQYAAVVQGTADYHATLPAAANAAGFLGVTLDGNTAAAESVPVVIMGTVWVQAAGAITAGNALVIANATGQVEATGSTTAPNIIGTALSSTTAVGDLVLMEIQGNLPLIASSLLKKVSGTTNATAGTQDIFAHGLPYTPTTVLITSKSNGVVYESQAADATNIYLSGSAVSLTFDAYVG